VTDSCLAERLGHYIALTGGEKRALAKLEETPADMDAGQVLFEEGEPLRELFVVKKGWFLSSTLLIDGERQILRLHFPGDTMGTASVAFEQASATVSVVQDATVCRYPRARLGELFEAHPRLAALFYAVGMLENVDLCDRLTALGRTDGKSRLANFFLSIFARMRILHGEDLDDLEIPLRQVDLGDAAGLTEVHVYRLLKQMEEEGLVARTRRRVKIIDEDRLVEIAQFRNRFAKIDTSWFPPPSDG
jgi:CRP-like cAMP-binding protein